MNKLQLLSVKAFTCVPQVSCIVGVINNDYKLNAYYADRIGGAKVTVSTPDPLSRFTIQQGVIACQTPIIQNSSSTASRTYLSFL